MVGLFATAMAIRPIIKASAVISYNGGRGVVSLKLFQHGALLLAHRRIRSALH